MGKEILTPEESLLLISKTIEETKEKFKENGHKFIFWGILTFIVSLCQFLIIQLELNISTGFPALLYVLGGIFVYIYERKTIRKKNTPKTHIGSIVFWMATVMGINLMILGPLFWSQLGNAGISVFLILLAFLVILCGVAIKYKPLLIGGISLNVIAFIPFLIDWQYHFLIMTAGSVVALIIPGILLNIAHRKDNV
jgi:hypothetical protein